MDARVDVGGCGGAGGGEAEVGTFGAIGGRDTTGGRNTASVMGAAGAVSTAGAAETARTESAAGASATAGSMGGPAGGADAACAASVQGAGAGAAALESGTLTSSKYVWTRATLHRAMQDIAFSFCNVPNLNDLAQEKASVRSQRNNFIDTVR